MKEKLIDSNLQFKKKDEISIYVEKKVNGVSYSEIRKELSDKGFKNEQISLMIKEIDEIVLTKEFNQSITSKIPFQKYAGLFFIGLAIIISIIVGGIGLIQLILLLSGLAIYASGSRFKMKPNPRSRKFGR